MNLPMHLVVLALASAALLIRAGSGWYIAGMVRSKNAAGAVVRNLADCAVAVLAFWVIGQAIFNYHGTWFLGLDPAMLFDARGSENWSALLQIVLILIAGAPLIGALAERCRFFPLLLAPALLGGIIIPIAAQWAWGSGPTGSGWLRRLGFFDAAGASVLHVVGGLFALSGACIVGPRTGKYNHDGSSNLIPGHNAVMVSLGAMLMLAGWLPYVIAASEAHGGLSSRTPTNVLLAGSSAALLAAVLSNLRYGKPDLMLTWSGLLGGLIAITGASGAVSSIAAVIIGAVAGAIVPLATVWLDLKWHVDDPGGGIASHAVGGAWGTIAVGIFAPAENYLGLFRQIGVQALGLLVLGGLALLLGIGLFLLLRATVGLRLSESAEYDGTDLAEHDINAYPDFQQTMIKSYHLREA
jgi:Amt family ammonium transporter